MSETTTLPSRLGLSELSIAGFGLTLSGFVGFTGGVIEHFSHRDDRASRIVSAFVVGDSDNEAEAQSKEHLRSCMDAASDVRSPEATVFD